MQPQETRTDRRDFLKLSARTGAAVAGGVFGRPPQGHAGAVPRPGARASLRTLLGGKGAIAITMWDFSWLERRWPGAGYEDWDQALDELKARGYDAVRIDAYPHLVAVAPDREWEILPVWNQQDWGAPALCRVKVQPSLNEFLGKCADRGVHVGLSTWFREDRDNSRMLIKSPQDLGAVWVKTLQTVDRRLRANLLYVDLCNEFPLDLFAPFLPKGMLRHSPEGARWMREAVAVVRSAFPDLDYTVSFTTEYETWEKQDVSMLDFLELHCWMTHWNDFYKQVGYNYERFDPEGYENLVAKGEKLYRSKPDFWKKSLAEGIGLLARWSRLFGKPLVTTECWAVVDYKDWPLLDWGWVKELCEFGVREACSTGRWVAMATSNFCGPQFVGMWRDVKWHRRMTQLIHASRVDFRQAQ